MALAWWWNQPSASELEATRQTTQPVILEGPLTLMDAYQRALKMSEDSKIAELDMEQARARYYRAFNLITPRVDFLWTHFRQDAEGTGQSGINSDFTRSETETARFAFTQPIFSGFKEIAVLVGSGADRRLQKHRYERAKELLFLDVANAYFMVIQKQKEAEAFRSIHNLLKERITDLEQRVSLGRSRESENQSAITDLKLIEADLAQAEADEAIVLDLLEFYMGEPLGNRTLVEEEPEASLTDLETALVYAQKRHDVLAAENAFQLSESRLISARSGLFPKVYADGNYYTHREGFQADNDWDVMLTVDVPVFDVPNVVGNIKEAAAIREADLLRYRKAKRSAELEIRNTYEDLSSANKIEQAMQAASDALKKNYDILTEEYKSNLVNNLDVLDALRRYQDTLKRYYTASYHARKMHYQYLIATGELTSQL